MATATRRLVLRTIRPLGPRPDSHDRAVSTWCVLLLAAIVLEGALRKWLLPPSLHPLAYGLKDVLVVLFLYRFRHAPALPLLRPLQRLLWPVALLLLPALLWGAFVLPAGALLTYKNATLWPLFALRCAAVCTPGVLRRVTAALALMTLPMAALALAQFNSAPEAAINRYAWVEGELSPATMPGGVRAAGTFSYLNGLAQFGAVAGCWLCWQLLAGVRSPQVLAGAGAALLCIFASGSRAPAAAVALALVAGAVAARRFDTLLRLTGAGTVIAALVVLALPNTDVIAAYANRAETAGDSVAERILGLGGLDFLYALPEFPAGLGLGTQSQVASYQLAQQTGAAGQYFIEDGRSRAVREAGVAGLAGLALTLALVVPVALRLPGNPTLIGRAGAGIGLVLTYYVATCLWFDHVATALWWLLAGVWLSVYARTAAPALTRRFTLS